MTPLPSPLGGRALMAWRLDQATYAQHWNSGEGAFRAGGRWNERGTPAVYCSLDPATAILEVAAHAGFRNLDAVPHVLSSLAISKPRRVKVIQPEELPDPAWLAPGMPDPAQQAWGEEMLARHGFLVLPSAVSRRSWNLVFSPAMAEGSYALVRQEDFEFDPRLGARR